MVDFDFRGNVAFPFVQTKKGADHDFLFRSFRVAVVRIPPPAPLMGFALLGQCESPPNAQRALAA